MDYSQSEKSYRLEFPFTCIVEEKIKGDGRDVPDTYIKKWEVECNITPRNTIENGFAQDSEYFVNLPYPDGSPIIYVEDRITVTTPMEVIIVEVDKTTPLSFFKKLQIYAKRTIWNLRPE